jgi:hypothetical protein
MVKGPSKETLHLMLGVVVLFADWLIRLAGYNIKSSRQRTIAFHRHYGYIANHSR